MELASRDYNVVLEMEVQPQERTVGIAVAVADVGDIRVAYPLVLLANCQSAPPVALT